MESPVELSIVICTRNRSSYLDGMLQSLTRLRSNSAWEVLLVDNGSSDDTALVIGRADDCGGRVRSVREERIGLGAARDAGWREARGRLISFTDDDCYLAPDYVDAVIGVFDKHAKVGCVGGRILLHDPDDAPVTIDVRDNAVEIATQQFVDAGEFHGANLSFRRSILETIGGLDPCLGAGTSFPCEDIDAVAATLWAGARVRFDPAPVVWHHHRRRVADVDKLFVTYDRGRGAYFAKYVLRPQTRSVYLRGWLYNTRHHTSFSGLMRLKRELCSASLYLVHRRAFFFLGVSIPIALIVYISTAVFIAMRTVKLK